MSMFYCSQKSTIRGKPVYTQSINAFASNLSKLLEEYELEADGFALKLWVTAEDYEEIRKEFSAFERHEPTYERGGSIWITNDTWRIEIYGRSREAEEILGQTH